ncbi:MAG: hypothetical protein HND47_09560 [Chloroflexi bacterium]|nr:hypothetical protein [Chloroflexota bacterium]
MKDKFPAGYSSPLRLLAITIVGIVVAEIAAMVVVYSLGPLPYYQITLIDAAIMATLIFPALYFLSFRPLILHIDRRRQAEENLRKARNELELRVQERTEELKAANRDLLRYITERKQAEAALRGRSEEYDRLASATPEEWGPPAPRPARAPDRTGDAKRGIAPHAGGTGVGARPLR